MNLDMMEHLNGLINTAYTLTSGSCKLVFRFLYPLFSMLDLNRLTYRSRCSKQMIVRARTLADSNNSYWNELRFQVIARA